MSVLKCLCFVCAVLCLAQIGHAVDGVLTYDFSNGTDELKGIAVAPDGKIVAAGTTYGRRDYDAVTIQLLPNGDLDSSFGDDGALFVDQRGTEDNWDVKVQSNGRRVVVGRKQLRGSHIFVLGIDDRGKLDKSFGAKGVFTFSFGKDTQADVYFLEVLPDDSIVLSGHVWYAYPLCEPVLVKLTPNGELDHTFGDGGIAHNNFTGADDMAKNVVYHNGCLYQAINPAGTTPLLWWGVAKYDAFTGQLDASFGADGIAIVDGLGAPYVALQSNGRILLGGENNDSLYGPIRLVALKPDATPDPAFGNHGDGTFLQPLPPVPMSGIKRRIVVLPGDGLLVMGHANYVQPYAAVLYPNGVGFDPSYGGTLVPGVAFSYTDFKAYDFAVQPDGKVVICGSGNDSTVDKQMVVIRFSADGSQFDPDF